jgi:lipopolysaccharide transport system ATP-binding protein
MTSVLVSARGLSKRYFLGADPFGTLSLRDRITDVVRSAFRRRGPEVSREFWALRDVDFDLHRGEVLGVIGRNGAGKSTLLKIISEITEPTEGEVELFGRVASLLEVGVGFHPELSGRENVFLNGAILGMTRAEMRRKFDEIVAFAEVEKFIDTPVKRYSSGMYVRLAFAVAAHLEPDVLIVDEVLAVGDAAFQRKCLGKMESVASQDRAVMVVSHNMSIVTQLCERVIWLDRGRVVAAGETSRVVSEYLSQGLTSFMTWQPDVETSDAFTYHEVSVARGDDEPPEEAFAADSSIDLIFDFTVKKKIAPGRLSFRVAREDGLVIVTSSNTDALPSAHAAWRAGSHRLRCTIPGSLLAPAKYFVTVSEPLEVGHVLHENILSFTVSDQNSLVARDRREGIIAPVLPWVEEPT